uniref:Uncharacterized protein n=1 Tax=Arundo donax TaxID=35708 RepID=A0A0A9FY64_ARUDO
MFVISRAIAQFISINRYVACIFCTNSTLFSVLFLLYITAYLL